MTSALVVSVSVRNALLTASITNMGESNRNAPGSTLKTGSGSSEKAQPAEDAAVGTGMAAEMESLPQRQPTGAVVPEYTGIGHKTPPSGPLAANSPKARAVSGS